MRGVTEDLTDLAKDLGLTFDVKLAQEDGAWVVSSEHDRLLSYFPPLPAQHKYCFFVHPPRFAKLHRHH